MSMYRMLRKLLALTLIVALCLSYAGSGWVALAEEPAATKDVNANLADWTVLIYMCGSNLESAGEMATGNLNMLAKVSMSDKVNFIIETGGAEAWSYEGIAADKLQRFRMNGGVLELLSSQESANMADPSTLRDFLQWGVKTYPAQKTMVIMWDHGGAVLGAIEDEIYNDAFMSVPQFVSAFRDAGIKFEAIGFDACLMASVEVASMLSPYAHYLIASEETEPGSGWDYEVLGDQLVNSPSSDGLRLGKVICDSYLASQEMSGTQYGATMSVIDLTKIQPVVDAVSSMAVEMGKLIPHAYYFRVLVSELNASKRYYYSFTHDLIDMARKADVIDDTVTQNVISAVQDAVVYKANANDFLYSGGLTITFGQNNRQDFYESYEDVCPSPEYLAFLDAITYKWTASDSLYEKTTRMSAPPYAQYHVQTELTDSKTSIPSLHVLSGLNALLGIEYKLIRVEEPDRLYLTAVNPDLSVDEDGCTFSPYFDGSVPTIDGLPCCLSVVEETMNYTLFETPVMVEGNRYSLRVIWTPPVADEPSAEEATTTPAPDATPEPTATPAPASPVKQPTIAEQVAASIADGSADSMTTQWGGTSTSLGNGTFTILGLWDSSYSGTNLPDRNIRALTSGMEITVLSQECDQDGAVVLMHAAGSFVYDVQKTKVAMQQVKDGVYALVYEVKDALGKVTSSEMISIAIKKGVISPYVK